MVRQVAVDIVELDEGIGRVRSRPDALVLLADPIDEAPRGGCVFEHENRSPLHIVADDGALDAPASMQDLHAAVVGSHQGAFAGRERHVELPLGVLAMDQQRSGEAERHLRHAGEILDVAARYARIDGVAGDMVQRRAGALADERLAGTDDLRAVIVHGIARQG